MKVTVATLDEKRTELDALFDTGSFYTILRNDCVPTDGAIFLYKKPQKLNTAGSKGNIEIIGESILVITISNKLVKSVALVSPDLRREMIIGAITMQEWDISINTRNGKTTVIVGRDMRDPEITEVD